MRSEHSRHVDLVRKDVPDYLRRAGSASEYEITLTVGGVKEEHASYVARQLFILQRIFKLDGTDVETTISAERGRDGVERVYELIPADPHA